MPSDKKQELHDVNYLWDNYSMYSSSSSIKVKCKTLDSTHKVKRVSCNLNGAIKLLYADKELNSLTDSFQNLNTIKETDFEIIKVGNRNYLTDRGETFSFMNKTYAMSKKEMLSLLKNIDSDYDMSLINNEICVEISSPEMLLEAYRNLINVITKIKIVGGDYNVWNKRETAKERERKKKTSAGKGV